METRLMKQVRLNLQGIRSYPETIWLLDVSSIRSVCFNPSAYSLYKIIVALHHMQASVRCRA